MACPTGYVPTKSGRYFTDARKRDTDWQRVTRRDVERAFGTREIKDLKELAMPEDMTPDSSRTKGVVVTARVTQTRVSWTKQEYSNGRPPSNASYFAYCTAGECMHDPDGYGYKNGHLIWWRTEELESEQEAQIRADRHNANRHVEE